MVLPVTVRLHTVPLNSLFPDLLLSLCSWSASPPLPQSTHPGFITALPPEGVY